MSQKWRSSHGTSTSQHRRSLRPAQADGVFTARTYLDTRQNVPISHTHTHTPHGCTCAWTHTHTCAHACISTRPPSCIVCDDFRAISAFGLSSLLLRKVGARRVGCVYSRGSPAPPLTFPVKKSTFLLGGDRTPERNDRSESRGSQARRPPARARPRGCGAKGWKTVCFEG